MAGMKEILSNVEALPALPSTVVKLIGMLNGGKAPIDEIEAIVRQDEALSMTILRIANSSMYASGNSEFNLKQSMVRLGGRTLLQIVLDQQVAKVFEGSGTAYGLLRGAMWRGAQAGAIAAGEIARREKFNDPELAFLCGLLRDVGKLVLDQHYGDTYLDQIADVLDHSLTFVEAEREALGFDHAMLGSELARHWGLPERIVRAIRFHHEPPASPPDHDPLIDLVHAGETVCLWVGLGIGADGLQYELADHVRVNMNLNRRTAEQIIDETWTQLNELESMMNGSMEEQTT